MAERFLKLRASPPLLFRGDRLHRGGSYIRRVAGCKVATKSPRRFLNLLVRRGK